MWDLTRHDGARLHLLISRHARFAGSRRAAQIIENWDAFLPKFRKVMPVEYRRGLRGLPGGETAKMETGAGWGREGGAGWGGWGKLRGFSDSKATPPTISRARHAIAPLAR